MPVSYPNQKMVYINRDMPKQTKESKRPYVVAYTDVIAKASTTLGTKHTAFRLFMYLLCNKDNYYFALSPQDFADEFGVSLKSAKDAVNDLIASGYLVLREKKVYDFYEVPHSLDIEPVETKKKKFKMKDGSIREFSYEELVDRMGEEKANNAWRNAQ